MAKANIEHDLWHIKQCPLFSAMTDEEKNAVRGSAEMVNLPRNTIVPPPPANDPCLYVVKEGFVQLTYNDDTGSEAIVILLGPGDVFGSIDPNDTPFGEHCRTVSETCLCRFPRDRFESLVRKYHDLAYHLTKLSMLRIKRLQVRLAEMMMRRADERLAIALLDLDEQAGRTDSSGRRKISIPLTHADLGKLIGTTREMVTMLLKKFRQEKMVETEKGWIYLSDIDAIRQLAHREKQEEPGRSLASRV